MQPRPTPSGPGRCPEQPLTRGLDQHENKSDPRTANLVCEMTQEDACEDERHGKRGKCRPDCPLARGEEERDKRRHRAEADAAQREADPVVPTAAITFLREARVRPVGVTRRTGAASSSVASGISVVASAMAVNP